MFTLHRPRDLGDSDSTYSVDVVEYFDKSRGTSNLSSTYSSFMTTEERHKMRVIFFILGRKIFLVGSVTKPSKTSGCNYVSVLYLLTINSSLLPARPE